jgi:hypothetical protein
VSEKQEHAPRQHHEARPILRSHDLERISKPLEALAPGDRVDMGAQLIPADKPVLARIHEARGIDVKGRLTDLGIGCRGERRMPLANLRQRVCDSRIVRAHEAGDSIVVGRPPSTTPDVRITG